MSAHHLRPFLPRHTWCHTCNQLPLCERYRNLHLLTPIRFRLPFVFRCGGGEGEERRRRDGGVLHGSTRTQRMREKSMNNTYSIAMEVTQLARDAHVNLPAAAWIDMMTMMSSAHVVDIHVVDIHLPHVLLFPLFLLLEDNHVHNVHSVHIDDTYRVRLEILHTAHTHTTSTDKAS